MTCCLRRPMSVMIGRRQRRLGGGAGEESGRGSASFFFEDLWEGNNLREIGGGRPAPVMMERKAMAETNGRWQRGEWGGGGCGLEKVRSRKKGPLCVAWVNMLVMLIKKENS